MSRFTVGLTGGVASGKSLVSAQFRALGVPVLDADQVSRAVVEPGQPALMAIAQRFGEDVLLADGRLDRRRLRQIVFADADARRDLERITHPPIRAAIRQWMDRQTAPYSMLENAILIESGMDRLVDRVLVVDVPESVQRQRLQQRDEIDLALVEQMLAAQSPRALRLERADDVLVNTGTPDQTADSVLRFHDLYLARAEAARAGHSFP
ncbi:dephospho-CoA kinase [Panacagrimonas sp.]|uniref:dephospho-CoA kinase n=1 Tax=Panacagrimonas sp. TaxID=2480088 RepID=UPI003B5274EB